MLRDNRHARKDSEFIVGAESPERAQRRWHPSIARAARLRTCDPTFQNLRPYFRRVTLYGREPEISRDTVRKGTVSKCECRIHADFEISSHGLEQTRIPWCAHGLREETSGTTESRRPISHHEELSLSRSRRPLSPAQIPSPNHCGEARHRSCMASDKGPSFPAHPGTLVRRAELGAWFG